MEEIRGGGDSGWRCAWGEDDWEVTRGGVVRGETSSGDVAVRVFFDK